MKKLLLVIAILILPLFAHSQVTKYKAVFTINFIRYIGWPDEAKKGDFVIGVLKDSEFAEFLKSLAKGRKFGFQDVVVKEFSSVDEITYCQVLYIPKTVNLSKNAGKIIDKLGGKNTLIITEKEGATKYGSMINFVIRDNKLKFEVHDENAARLGLQISSKLGNMASAIKL
ncbi:MAG: YfiR family protein [Chlorobi bacterium]|nr:YfiR family protein [Chlorobiota bacterium]